MSLIRLEVVPLWDSHLDVPKSRASTEYMSTTLEIQKTHEAKLHEAKLHEAKLHEAKLHEFFKISMRQNSMRQTKLRSWTTCVCNHSIQGWCCNEWSFKMDPAWHTFQSPKSHFTPDEGGCVWGGSKIDQATTRATVEDEAPLHDLAIASFAHIAWLFV